jgi:hypothetical protein
MIPALLQHIRAGILFCEGTGPVTTLCKLKGLVPMVVKKERVHG